MELWDSKFRRHGRLHGSPWNVEIGKVKLQWSCMEFHTTLGVIEIGNIEVAHNPMKFIEIWFPNFDDNSFNFAVYVYFRNMTRPLCHFFVSPAYVLITMLVQYQARFQYYSLYIKFILKINSQWYLELVLIKPIELIPEFRGTFDQHSKNICRSPWMFVQIQFQTIPWNFKFSRKKIHGNPWHSMEYNTFNI